MEHVFSGILKVWASILNSVMSVFTSEFWKDFQIYEIRDMGAQELARSVFSGSSLFGNDAVTQTLAFRNLFPGLNYCIPTLMWMGVFICTLMLLIGLVRAMLPQDMDQDIEHPVRVVTRFAIAYFAVFWSYRLMALFTSPLALVAQEIYKLPETNAELFRRGVANDSGEFDAPYPDFSLEAEGEAGRISNRAETYGSMDPSAGSDSVLFIQNADFSDIGTFALVLILMTMMCLAYLRLVLELVERWMTLVFLIYVSPLAMSTLSSAGMKPVFKKYVQMVFSEYLLIMFNYMFVFIFAAAYVKRMTDATTGSGDGAFKSLTEAALFFIIMTAWCKLGQRLDEHLNTMGVSAARTGVGLGGEMVGAATMTAGAAIAAGRAAKSAFRTGKGIGKSGHDRYEKHKTAEAEKAKKEADRRPGDLGVAKSDTFKGMLKEGDLSTTSPKALSALAAAGAVTNGVESVAIGQRPGANGEPVGAMQINTKNGSYEAVESTRQMSSQSSIANVGQDIGGTYMATPIPNPDAFGDSYIKELASSGGFKGYSTLAAGDAMPAGAELLQDKNGDAFLAVNTGLYNAEHGTLISAKGSANDWRAIPVDAGIGNEAATEMALGMQKKTTIER